MKCIIKNCGKDAAYSARKDIYPMYCYIHTNVHIRSNIPKCKVCESPGHYCISKTQDKFCRNHRPEKSKLISNFCRLCNRKATWREPTEKLTRCIDHRTTTMINANYGKSKCVTCMKKYPADKKLWKQPSFGYEKATHCLEHSSEDMKDIRHTSSLCLTPNCGVRASYGAKNRPQYCVKCSKNIAGLRPIAGTICAKCNSKQGVFGYAHDILRYCKNCASPDMENVKARMCEKCNKHQPVFGFKNDLKSSRCKNCIEPLMMDIVNPRCNSCELFIVSSKTDLCSYCNPEKQSKNYVVSYLKKQGHIIADEKSFTPMKFEKSLERKEMKVVQFLLDNNHVFIHNKSCGPKDYGGYRPDIRIDKENYSIIVEIDENQHKHYDQFCEYARMFNIAQAIQKKCYFIRYNPDSFIHTEDDKRPSKVAVIEKSLECLSSVITKCEKEEPAEIIDVIYMFYDYPEQGYITRVGMKKLADKLGLSYD